MKKRIMAALLLVTVFLSAIGGTIYAEAISAGGNAYVNITKYCTEGAPGASDSSSKKTYLYTMHDGGKTYLRMMYLSGSNGEGASMKKDKNGTPIWVYCIEFGTAIESYNERTASDITKTSVWKNLSPTQQLGITLATMYGCPVSNLGASVADAYAATQCVIWEYQTGIRTSVTKDERKSVTYKGKKLSKTYFSNVLKGTAGETAYKNLIKLMKSHSVSPSFSGTNAIIPYRADTGKYELTLTDQNHVLSSYSVKADSEDLTLKKSGDKLKITSSKPIEEGKLTLKRKLPDLTSQSFLALSASAGQATVVGQTKSAVTTHATVETDKGKLKIVKTATDNKIEDVTFTVKGMGSTYTVKTDENGKATLKNLPAGSYTITEKADKKYEVQAKKTVLISSEKTATAAFHNVEKPRYHTVSVYKKGETLSSFLTEQKETPNGKTYDVRIPVYEEQYLEGCKVEIVAAENIKTPAGDLVAKKGTVVDTLVTRKDGPVTSKKLNEGTYFLREAEAPKGYALDVGTTPINLFKDAEVTIENQRVKAVLQFQKELAGTVIGDLPENPDEDSLFHKVAFGLYCKEDILDEPAGTLLDVIVPDYTGTCSMNVDLPFGYEYYLKELSTEKGYLLSKKKYPVDFTAVENGVATLSISINEGKPIVNEKESTTTTTTTTTTSTTTHTDTTTVTTPTPPDTGDTTPVMPIVAVAVFTGMALFFLERKRKMSFDFTGDEE